MPYPKPLSEKSLNRLYMQAGLSMETCAFLHSLFAACANLYGAIALRDVWAVCIDKQHKALAISGVVRNKLNDLHHIYTKDCAYSDSKETDSLCAGRPLFLPSRMQIIEL